MKHAFETADLGVDRSAALRSLVEDVADRLAHGELRCAVCRYRVATHPGDATGIRPLCDICKADADCDQEIAQQKRRRERMRGAR